MDRPDVRKPPARGACAGDTRADAASVTDLDAKRKALDTLRAEAALMGYEVLALPDGRLLCCRWSWCRLCRDLRELARFLDRKGIV